MTNTLEIDAFVHLLFSSAPFILNERLLGLRNAMAATLVMYYADMKKECKAEQHLVLRKMEDAAKRANVPIKDLKSYSNEIKSRFVVLNAPARCGGSLDDVKNAIRVSFHSAMLIESIT